MKNPPFSNKGRALHYSKTPLEEKTDRIFAAGEIRVRFQAQLDTTGKSLSFTKIFTPAEILQSESSRLEIDLIRAFRELLRVYTAEVEYTPEHLRGSSRAELTKRGGSRGSG